MDWFEVENISAIDSPALLVYPSRVSENIRLAILEAGDPARLRPHVKTNKMAEVCAMMMRAGITKFKCATIAEAEMLGGIGAPDVLLAYQPVGPKVARFLSLVRKFPRTAYSCLVDNLASAQFISSAAAADKIAIDAFIDLNTGMNRTGVVISQAFALYKNIADLPQLRIKGFHAYDGHLRDVDLATRQDRSDRLFAKIASLVQDIRSTFSHEPVLVLGGSPTFATHIGHEGAECSPGTFVFWDYGYRTTVPEQPFQFAALVMTRVISIVDERTICIDLGYKSISSESPLPRVHFINAPEAKATAHSEEHLVLEVENSAQYKPGDVLYGVPMHICPTVALYERAEIIEDHKAIAAWRVVARDRTITI